MEKKMKSTASLIVAALLCGCSTAHRSNVADTFGYTTGSRMVEIGSHQVHYGSNGTSDLLLVARGNHNLFSTEATNSTVFVGGRSFVDYSDEDGVLNKYMIHLRDEDGNDTITLVDDNADGTIDHKIDHNAKRLFDWAGDRWVERKKQ
jgi:hypothetical protein